MLLLGTLAALWMVPVPHASAQAPTEEELKDVERQLDQMEKEQAEAAAKAEAKRKADAAKKAAAAAEAKRKAARKQAEESRPAEEARSASQKASALAGEFVDIPGGTFQMGCSVDDDVYCRTERPVANELPVHAVSIKPFRMGKYEVTVGQFRRFVEAASYRTDAERGGGCTVLADGNGAQQAGRDWKNPDFPQTDKDPVVCVSWNDAKAYVQWLSRQSGGRYRLPSESEWEYAGRAGSSARYFFGDSEAMLCTYGNVADRTSLRVLGSNRGVAPCDDGALYTAPVGSYRPNGFGLYDMHGNVTEWTEDCFYGSYAAAPSAGYANAPSDGTARTNARPCYRVIRDGNWYSVPMSLRSAIRGMNQPDARNVFLGFRLAQDK